MSQPQVRRKRPRDRRQAIEAAAAELFAARGFAATGLSDIAAKVGVTPAALYRHFAGKDELLATIVNGAVAGMGDAARDALQAPDEDAEQLLRRVLATLLDLGRAMPDAVTIYIRERHRLTGPARQQRHRGEQRLAGQVRSLIRRARPGLSAAETTGRLRAMNGVLATAATQRHHLAPTRLRQLYVDGLTAVLLAPPSPDPGPPAAAARWTPPRTRRQEILAAAAPLFRQHGYAGAGVDQIGQAAGIAGPTVYGTFPSKADILVDAVDHAVAMREVLTERALASASSPEEAVTRLAEAYAATILANLDIIAAVAHDLDHLPDADRLRVRRRQADYQEHAEMLLGQVRTDLTEAEARALLMGAYALVNEMAQARLTPSVETTSASMVVFLTGAQPKS